MVIRPAINTKRESIWKSTNIGFAVTALLIIVIGIYFNSSVIAEANENLADSTTHSTKSNRKYVGTKRCRMCHTNHYESWSDRAKSNSFNALKPGQSAAVKRIANLDVLRDYTKDESCLPCHTVGFGEPGGYTIPNPTSGRSIRRAAAREGVGCESCHGPGSDFVLVMQSLAATGRSYDSSELAPLGRLPVTKHTCRRCHNENALCMTGVIKNLESEQSLEWTKVDIGNHLGYHAAIALKQRERKPITGDLK